MTRLDVSQIYEWGYRRRGVAIVMAVTEDVVRLLSVNDMTEFYTVSKQNAERNISSGYWRRIA